MMKLANAKNLQNLAGGLVESADGLPVNTDNILDLGDRLCLD